ncbi:MAG: hypothetical protein ACAF41_11670 [Leptolyngbya sp. BL-A-14]
MSTPEEKRDFLLKDFSAISSIRISYASMRLAALGTVLTLIGGIIAFSKNIAYPDIFGIYIVLLLIVFTGIRIISVHNRAIYVFLSYLKWVEEEIGEIGFSSQWSRYIRFNQRDSGSYAFVVATRAMNFATTFYIVFDSSLKLPANIAVVVVSILIAICVWNEVYIRRQLDPKGFVDRISKELIRARELCLKERGQL